MKKIDLVAGVRDFNSSMYLPSKTFDQFVAIKETWLIRSSSSILQMKTSKPVPMTAASKSYEGSIVPPKEVRW